MGLDAWHRCFLRWMALAVALVAPFAKASSAWGAEPARVAVLYSQQKSYREAVSSIETVLKQAGHTCVLVELPKDTDKRAQSQALERLAGAKPTIVAASGATATSLALKTVPHVPVVFFMLPNALDAPFMQERSRDRARVAGVSTDISPKDQIDWIAKLHPVSRRIGVLHSPNTKRTVRAIKDVGRKRDIEIVPIDANRDEFPKAIEALNQKRCNGVIMVPDARVYSSPNVRRLLLWGIRQKRPVWAFSANIVKAGAFSGQFVDGKVVGRRTAELIKRLMAGAAIKSIGLQYPSPVGKAVNLRTAELIGVPVEGRIPKTGVTRYGED